MQQETLLLGVDCRVLQEGRSSGRELSRRAGAGGAASISCTVVVDKVGDLGKR
jgi:hypothetical protein